MFRSVIASLSLGMVCSLYAGCAVDECDKYPERDKCNETDMGSPGGTLTISPRRLNIKGDIVTVTMSAKTSPDDLVTIKQGQLSLELGILGSGKLTLSGGSLNSKGFKPGIATLVIGTQSEAIRFYLTPIFPAAATASIATNTDIPNWVGISEGKKIVMLSEANMGVTPVHFVEYQIDNLLSPWVGGKIYPKLNTKATMTPSLRYSAHPDASAGNKVVLRKCPLGSDNCDEIVTSRDLTADISVSRDNSLLGITTGQTIDAYFISSTFAGAPSKEITGVDNPQLIAAGDLDNDGMPDLLVWNGSMFTALKQTSSTATVPFAIDSDISTEVNNAIGSDKPLAIVIRDIDGDELDDIIYSFAGKINWLNNLGISAQDQKIKFSKNAGSIFMPSNGFDSFSVDDIDADKKSDLAFAHTSSKQLSYYLNQANYP
jgi:hypothetical protein